MQIINNIEPYGA